MTVAVPILAKHPARGGLRRSQNRDSVAVAEAIGGLMAHDCRGCRTTLKRGMKACPACGAENQTGANESDVLIVGAVLFVDWFFWSTFNFNASFRNFIFSLFSN